jgi:hypothetical protein
MPFPGSIYAPPGVYTRTLFENPIQGVLAGVRIPIFIGTGNEILQQQDLEVIRGSSSSVDQQVPQEDETGRAVVEITATGEVVLGDFNGDRRRLQVRNFPIVSGDGSGTTATDPSTVLVTINGRPDVVLSVARADIGVIEISTAPNLGDDVRVTYFFNRTDTQTTDNVSEQISTGAAILNGAIGNAYEFTDETNTFSFRVDDDQNQEITVTFPTGAVTAATVVSLINGAAAATSLVSSTFENNFGQTAVRLSAARDIRILGGTANAVLGFTEGTDTNRNKTFYVFNGPIVDGTNGGITTTDTSKVTVRLDGVQVIPSSVDGQTRAVTLPFAPEDGATLTIEYYFNTWQDTFDYLANIGITDVLRCGIVPGNNDFVQGADYVLKDDKIVWGTSFLVGPGITTPGAPEFGESQISGLLVDNRWFLAPTTPVVNTTVNPPLETRKDFSLPLQPTTGNGRNNPLGQQAFLSIANNRVDLATNNPNLVTAYWGFGPQDAIQRGPVEVTAVNGTTITLKDAVPVGAEVWATFYYNILVDNTYTLQVETSGPSGIGTYFIFDANGNPVYTPKFGVKGPALTGVTIQFPSGSELTPDVHFEGGQKGPVEETITVTFADKDATIAKFTVNGSGPYEFVSGASDRARFLIDSSPLAGGAVGIDLSAPNGEQGLGFLASLLGEEISYTDDSGKTTYDILQGINDDFSAQVDDVVISVTVPAQSGVNADAYVEAINAQAKLAANKPFYTASSRFLGATVITAGEYDTFVLNYTGVTAGASGPVQISIPAGTYTSPNAFAAAVNSATGTAIGALPAAFDGLDVEVTANANGQLQFALCAATGDLGTFATGTVTNTSGGLIGDTIDIDGVTLVGALTQSSGSLTWDTGQARATVIATGVQPSDTIDIDGGSGVIQLTALGAQTPGGLNFDEGDQATGSITLNGALPVLGTVVPAADTVTVDGVTITAVEGAPVGLQFDAGTRSTGNCTLAAVQYGDQVTINPSIFGGVSVTLTAANTQGPGNLDYNVGTAAQGSVTVSGVLPGDVLNISGNPLTAVEGAAGADQFDCGTRSEGSITLDTYAASPGPGVPMVGTKLGDQIAIAGVTLTAVDTAPGVLEFTAGVQATATITIVNDPVPVIDTITIDGGGVFNGGFVITPNATPNNAGTTFGGDTGTGVGQATIAANLRDLINDGSIFGGDLALNVTATSTGNVVTLTINQPGVIGNTVLNAVVSRGDMTTSGNFGTVVVGVGDANTAAASLDAAIGLAANGLTGTVTSTVALNVCTIQAVTPGTAGDSINIVTTAPSPGVTIAAMGTVTAGIGDDQFVSDNVTTAINAPANSFDLIVSADNGSGTLTTVTLTAVTPGAVGNTITLTVSPAPAAARLTVATMGTVTFGVGDDISAASSLVAAINDAGNGLAPYVFADNAGGTLAVVTVTAIQPGANGDFVGTTENTGATRLSWGGFVTLQGGIGDDNTAATSLQSAIAANVASVTALDVLNAVNLTAVTPGNVGNLITLASTDATRIALTGPTLDGGLGTDITVASSIVAAINDLGNGLSVDVMADNDGGTSSTVTVWALVPGIAGNANTIASSDGTRLPVSAWGGGLTTVNSATNIVTAINDAGNGLNGIVTADNTSGTSATVDISAAVPGPLGNNITLASSDAGRLPVSAATLTGGVGLGGGYLEFLDAPTLASDFAILAGISTDALPGQEQTKLIAGDIVRRFSVAGTSGRLIYDRLILRNRLVPGSGSVYSASQVALTQLVVAGTNAADYTGLQSGAIGLAGSEATVQASTLFGEVGFKDGQVPSGTYGDERDGMPQVTFYAEGGTQPQNNVFKVNIDGIPFTTEFTDASGAGIPVGGNADVPLGPVTIANTVLEQIQRAAVVQGLSPNVIQIEGAGIRFVSQLTTTDSAVTIDSANANDTLGFSDGAASTRTLVQPEVAASALMAHAAAAVSDIYLDYANPDSTYFAAQALAGVERDSSNAEFLFIESQANNFVGLGTASNITLDNATADSWLLPGTGLNNVAGDGASGEAGFQGYYVTSSDLVDGSGTADTSCLNNGVGQDGIIGQSYRDTVTGLVFTILPREGGAAYPVGPGSYFTFKVTRLTTTDANLPVNSIPGLELLVSNTEGSTIPTGDTALVETIEKGGLEPAVGDSYFVTYNYSKTQADFETKLFTSQRVLEREYGPINPDFPLSLAGFLGFTNGAVIVGCKQVPKVPGSNQASVPSYLDALETLRGPLPGGVFLDTITPLRGDSLQLFQAIGAHCDIQSSIRYRAERTSIIGVASGTQPDDVGDIANAINNTRMRLVYPDIVFLTIQDALGNNKQFLVDGPYLAAAMAGNRATPSIDVATPWTRARLVSFDQLARTLDAVQQNQVAVQGITVLEDRNPIIQVRQGLTTNISNILTKTPTIITIADEVQRQARATLDRFIGIKFLPGVLQDIEGQLAFTLKQLKNAEIIAAYTGVQANTTNDPTTVEVEAFYQPVFPLLYIVVTFNLRSNLGG